MSNSPIVERITDSLDFYKFTMSYFARKYFPDVRVRYEFINRTQAVRLLDHIDLDRLRDELLHVQHIGFSAGEINALKKRDEFRIFPEWYFDLLQVTDLSPISVEERDGRLAIETTGNWATEAIWWETIVLGIVSELYCESVINTLGISRHAVMDQGRSRMTEKFTLLHNEVPDARIALFGARRRFSNAWEDEVHIAAKELLGDSTPTSTVGKGLRFDMPIVGTNAHELPMVLFGLHRNQHDPEHNLGDIARDSQLELLDTWWDLYGEDLSVALTDTYGTPFFLDHFGEERARAWRGFRQDSGDPAQIARTYIRYYESLGIDPKEKSVLFSDGLVPATISMLQRTFGEQIMTSFGVGTNFTNDLLPREMLMPVSIVMKAVNADGASLVKLSDNPAKFTGDADVAERLKSDITYNEQPWIDVTY